jgi:hypothetical protein
MGSYQVQEFLFQRIKELLPVHVSMVDGIAEILHLSPDSAYRRIRGETPLVLDEVKQLCDHFHLSLDQLLSIKAGATIFQNIRIDYKKFDYPQYLRGILKDLQQLNDFLKVEVIYLSKDIPFFHNFYFQPLIAFRYFFWMKTMMLDPHFAERHFDLSCLTPEIENLSREVLRNYQNVHSTEIWNIESINSTISQIEFYKDSGYFTSAADIRTVYEALEETIQHMNTQVEYGSKFMPGENPQVKKNNLMFFYNRAVLGDNTILVLADQVKTVYLNYGVLNYIVTKDETFCNDTYNDLQNLKKRSTLISQTSERQRNIFFGVLLAKIQDRKNRL